jgi:phosphoribosyl-ATP pyrophosphohydrolase
VLYLVRRAGPVRHTGSEGRYLRKVRIPMADERFLAQLWATIESRKADETGGTSYTQELLSNPSVIRRKIIEEAYEMNEAHQALEAGRDSKDHLAHEAADLLYHVLVLLSSADVTPSEVYAVLERRHRPPPPLKPVGGGNP